LILKELTETGHLSRNYTDLRELIAIENAQGKMIHLTQEASDIWDVIKAKILSQQKQDELISIFQSRWPQKYQLLTI
jgi:hypothetical protein